LFRRRPAWLAVTRRAGSLDALVDGISAAADSKSCHDAIHDLIPDEKELGRHYNTMEKLLAHPQVAAYVKWKRERVRKATN
jgi:hypothetical protein